MTETGFNNKSYAQLLDSFDNYDGYKYALKTIYDKKMAEAENKIKQAEAKRKIVEDARREAEREAQREAEEIQRQKEAKRKAEEEEKREADKIAETAKRKEEAESKWNLGILYANGDGVPKDLTQAVRYLEEAANQSDYYKYKLGERYADGNLIPHDSEKALYWMEKATNEGDSYSTLQLAIRYTSGHGIPKRPELAIHWIQKVIEIESKSSEKWAARYLAHAYCLLGCFYADGYFFSKNPEKAQCYLEKAGRFIEKIEHIFGERSRDNDSCRIMFEIGRRYANGEGVPYDFNKAIYWLEKSTHYRSHYCSSYYHFQWLTNAKFNSTKWLAETGYIDNGDETITDTKFGLMWKKYPEGFEITPYSLSTEYIGMLFIKDDGDLRQKEMTGGWDWSWLRKIKQEGKSYKYKEAMALPEKINENSGFAGYTDWRIPTIEDLQSLNYPPPSIPERDNELCNFDTIFLNSVYPFHNYHCWCSSLKNTIGATLFGNKYSFIFAADKYFKRRGYISEGKHCSSRNFVRLVRNV